MPRADGDGLRLFNETVAYNSLFWELERAAQHAGAPPDIAVELAQDQLLQMWQDGPRAGIRNHRAWGVTCVTNRARNYLASPDVRRRAEPSAFREHATDSPPEDACDAENVLRLDAALEKVLCFYTSAHVRVHAAPPSPEDAAREYLRFLDARLAYVMRLLDSAANSSRTSRRWRARLQSLLAEEVKHSEVRFGADPGEDAPMMVTTVANRSGRGLRYAKISTEDEPWFSTHLSRGANLLCELTPHLSADDAQALAQRVWEEDMPQLAGDPEVGELHYSYEVLDPSELWLERLVRHLQGLRSPPRPRRLMGKSADIEILVGDFGENEILAIRGDIAGSRFRLELTEEGVLRARRSTRCLADMGWRVLRGRPTRYAMTWRLPRQRGEWGRIGEHLFCASNLLYGEREWSFGG